MYSVVDRPTDLAAAEHERVEPSGVALPDLSREDLHLEREEAVALEHDVLRPQHDGHQLVEGVLVQVAPRHLQPPEPPASRVGHIKVSDCFTFC